MKRKLREKSTAGEKAPIKFISSTTQLANHVGLSRWTVSRILNGHASAKPETRKLVLDAAREFNFTPSPLCDALLGRRTGMIGVCFHSIDSHLLSSKIQALNRSLHKHGYRSIIEIANQNRNLEHQVISHFISIRVDAIVMAAPWGGLEPKTTDLLVNYGRPILLLECEEPTPFVSITPDHAQGFADIVQHLFDNGHRHFGWLGPELSTVSYSRREGLNQGFQQCGLSIEKDLVTLTGETQGFHPEWFTVIDPDMEFNYGCAVAKEFLALADRPTALIASNDYIAAGAIRTLLEAGIQIPGEVSVTGYDNVVNRLFFSPAITTVDQNLEAFSSEIAEALRLSFEQPLEPAIRSIAPKLLVGKSTGPASAQRKVRKIK